MKRLTERFSNGQAAVYGCGNNCKYEFKYCNNHLEDCPTINEIYEKLAIYEELEEQGLLLKLPCKIGTKVYYVDDCDCSKCQYTFIDCEEIKCPVTIKETEFIYRMIPYIGTSYYLTLVEAENATKG